MTLSIFQERGKQKKNIPVSFQDEFGAGKKKKKVRGRTIRIKVSGGWELGVKKKTPAKGILVRVEVARGETLLRIDRRIGHLEGSGRRSQLAPDGLGNLRRDTGSPSLPAAIG